MRYNFYLTTGRIFFGVSILAIGIIHLATANFPTGLLPVSGSLPGRNLFVYASGIAMIISGILMLTKKYAWPGALLAQGIFLLFLLFLHIPKLITHLNVSSEWTPAFEVFMLFSGALILGGIVLTGDRHENARHKLIATGKYCFAISLFVFAVLHFLFTKFVVSIIPGWIPWPLFWAYFAVAAFFAASLSIFIQKRVRLSATLLSLMFFLWVCMLHVPELIADIHIETSWTNLFVPLAMSGIGLLIAGTAKPPLSLPG
jgi:uncharacterized membrane protein